MPRVKPLGTQPDPRPIGFVREMEYEMVRHKIKSVAELSRLTGINDKTLKSRMDHPEKFQFKEIVQIADVLNMKPDDYEKAVKEVKTR